ncbi:hypothetical protein DC498_11595 [Terrimonas sp.]|uniref:glycosyltransferase family 4 protein n=1 Tax=Terrimonas sp. TaxID=1914338 RepID=UPI000D512DFA|nr:glycosyltransferase family 4 protein [Terrimonas sp.]PVD52026.1 hypothetical protein DC498_11595 [Terrimonas sp.]
MRIIFISTMAGNPWGGSEELWVKSADYALSKGHEVIISVYDWGKLHHKLTILKSKGAQFHFRKRIFYGHSLSKRAYGKLVNIIFFAKQIITLRKFAPDVVFVSQGTIYESMQPAFVTLIKRTGARLFIITQANTEYETIPNHCFNVGRTLFDIAERLFFVSNRNKCVAERQLAMRFKNSGVISNPANLHSVHSDCKWNNSEIINFACVGRLNSTVKGLGVLFEILGQPQWKNREYILNLYGKGTDQHYLQELASLYGVEKHIFFRGFVNSIEEIWNENHVLLMPSTLEGTPLALIEAMLCARTAVVSDVGGNAELIEDGACGFVSEAPSPNSFGKAMERMWDQRKQLQMLGVKAKKVVLNKIDLESYKKIIDSLS